MMGKPFTQKREILVIKVIVLENSKHKGIKQKGQTIGNRDKRKEVISKRELVKISAKKRRTIGRITNVIIVGREVILLEISSLRKLKEMLSPLAIKMKVKKNGTSKHQLPLKEEMLVSNSSK